jgi:hypothetical protein
MTLGNLDSVGVGRYDPTIPISPFDELLNMGLESVSEVLATLLPRVCVLRRTANQNLTVAAAAITWDVEIADASAMHSNTVNNSRIIAPVAGLYKVTASMLNTNTSGMGTIFGRVDGGTDVAGSLARRVGDASAACPLLSVFTVSLAAGQYVEIMAQHATAAGAITGGATTGAAVVTMERLSA